MQEEDVLFNFIEQISAFDFVMAFQLLGLSIVLLWFFVVVWVWNDSSERSTSLSFRVFSVLFVLPLNVFGLFIYLLIRPRQTIEEVYWSDLERRYLIYETSDLGDCKNCGYQLAPGYNVCPQCANEIRRECAQCNTMIDKNWKFCPQCGFQQLKKRVAQPELTPEVMEVAVTETEKQVVQSVVENKTRYSKKRGIASQIGSSVIKGFSSLSALIARPSKKRSKSALEVDNDEMSAINKDFSRENSNRKRKKKKKKRRK